MIDKAEELISFCRENGRVCPLPGKWNDLWNTLPARSHRDNGWEPALPLILAAWAHSSIESKRERLAEHVLWADAHDAFPEVASFLLSLPEEQWLHLGEWPA